MKPLLFSLLFSLTLPAVAAEPPVNRYAAVIAPTETFESGGWAVEKHGNAGRALILVPDLASGAWAWQSVVRALARDYTIYIVTLPGFDGRPFAAGSDLDTAVAGIRTLIARRHLDHPVVIGHGLGATIGYLLAEDTTQALGGLVAIDGLPVAPGTEGLAPVQRTAMVAGMSVQPPAPAAFLQQQQAAMRTVGVLDIDQAAALAQLTARSDPAAVVRYAADALTRDLRPELARITAPVLVLAPWFDQDAIDAGTTPEAKAAYYQSLLPGVARVQVLPVPESRHFIMFDQPELLNTMLRTWLTAL